MSTVLKSRYNINSLNIYILYFLDSKEEYYRFQNVYLFNLKCYIRYPIEDFLYLFTYFGVKKCTYFNTSLSRL